MDVLSVSLRIDQDEGLTARFTIKLQDFKIGFFNIYERDPKQRRRGYRDFVNGKQDLLNFAESKGHITIARSPNEMVRCGMTYFGENGDGEIVFYLRFDIMKEHLMRLADLLEPETE